MSDSLASQIEHYIKQLLSSSYEGTVEVSRQELARKFSCVPSQINYVLSTRFTVEQGYIIESRRGGGGYLRISKVDISSSQELVDMLGQIGDRISQSEAINYISWLLESGIIEAREAHIIRAVIHRKTLAVVLPERDFIRANIFKAIVLAVAQYNK